MAEAAPDPGPGAAAGAPIPDAGTGVETSVRGSGMPFRECVDRINKSLDRAKKEPYLFFFLLRFLATDFSWRFRFDQIPKWGSWGSTCWRPVAPSGCSSSCHWIAIAKVCPTPASSFVAKGFVSSSSYWKFRFLLILLACRFLAFVGDIPLLIANHQVL